MNNVIYQYFIFCRTADNWLY